MVKQAVNDSIFGARVFYAVVGVFMLSIFLMYDDDLSIAIAQGSMLYVLGFFANLGLAIYFFMICGQNPGYLDVEKEKQKEESASTLSEMQIIEIPEKNIKVLEPTANNYINLIENTEEDRGTLKDSLLPERHFCDVCGVYQPVRTKHCDLCEKCVHKYDHHCFWIGACVGEFNHRKFWAFLFFQTILHIWCFQIGDSGLDHYMWQPNLQNNEEDYKASGYTSEYAAFMLCCLTNFIFTLFAGALLIYHTYLISSNQTTWEFSRRSQISYLRIYPKGFLPFDTGFFNNLKLTFLHDNQRKTWTLPSVEVANATNTFNWCDNEYYSCC